MSITNTSKPATSIVNTNKISSVITNPRQAFAGYWDDSLNTWDSSTINWSQGISTITNTSKPS